MRIGESAFVGNEAAGIASPHVEAQIANDAHPRAAHGRHKMDKREGPRSKVASREDTGRKGLCDEETVEVHEHICLCIEAASESFFQREVGVDLGAERRGEGVAHWRTSLGRSSAASRRSSTCRRR